MKIGNIICLAASCALTGCFAPLIGAVGSMGALGGQTVLMKNSISRQNRKIVTAQAIGGDVDYKRVKISGLQRGDGLERWTAETPDGRYDCTLQIGHTNPKCASMR